MRIKRTIIFTLFLMSFLSFTFSSAQLNYVTNDTMLDFYYSDHIVPDEELVWNVAKFQKEDDVNWTIKPGHLVEEGDTIKFKIILDPDAIALTDILDLHFTETKWAEFYLNDVLLGNDASELNLFIDPFTMSYVIWGYILPTDIEFATGNVSYFDFIYDEIEPLQFNNGSGLYKVEKTDTLLTIKWEYTAKIILVFMDTIRINRVVEVSYNLEWGYLDRLKIFEKYQIGNNDPEELDLVLLNSKSTQKVPINWTTGLFALFLLGAVAGYIRRR